MVVDLLLKTSPNNRKASLLQSMANNLHKAIGAITIFNDDPITLSDDPKFCVFEANKNSLMGRLLNPECQVMSRMINYMPTAWRVYRRV